MFQEMVNRVLLKLRRRILSLNYKSLILLKLNRLTFTFNYLVNIWGNSDSRSGEGSTLQYTEHVRSELPKLIKQLGVRSVLDIPCGDLFWMKEILERNNLNLEYAGVDIVGSLIKKNNKKYSSDKISFYRENAIDYNYGEYDLVLVRDFFFHISFKDMNEFLKNFLHSGSRYLLTSSYVNNEENIDILNGDFREINILKPPFYFSLPEIKIRDYVSPYPERYLYLFEKEDVDKAYKQQLIRGVQY